MTEDIEGQMTSGLPSGGTLFHYTNAAGLLGILSSSHIWATDLRFLNDSEEAIFAREPFLSALRAVENPALRSDHPLHHMADDFGRTFAGYKGLFAEELADFTFPVYVCCFCESGDLLSQWRAYGNDHGYAIEINAEMLQSQVRTSQNPSELVRVRYGYEAAKDVVEAAMHAVSQDTNLGHPGVHAHFMALRLALMLATIKHPGFAEEKEWRAVSAFEYQDPQPVKFRATSMAVVPYVDLPLPTEAITSIRVGPGRYVDVRKEGVARLLRKIGSEATVLHSNLPLRT